MKVLDSLLDKYEYVPLEIIEKRSKLPPSRLSKALLKLGRFKAVIRRTGAQTGYRITYIGLDLLALNSLSRTGIVAYLGTKVGMGKESEIYIAKNSEGEFIAVKFYKIGRVSFQKVKRVRSYLIDESNWMIRSKVTAEREYKALKDLSRHTPYVPKVYGWNRHAIVMSYIPGVELYRYKVSLDPKGMLIKILSTLRSAYIETGIVHGDLSEYNVVVHIKDNEEVPYIIDWPQYLYKDDPLSGKYLRRDVEYILKFFKRRYRINLDVERAIKYVTGREEIVE